MNQQLQSQLLRFTVEAQTRYAGVQAKSRAAVRRLASERGDAASSVIMMAGLAAAAIAVIGIVTVWLRGRAQQLNELPSTATTVP